MASIWALPSMTADQGPDVTGVAAVRLGERIVDDFAKPAPRAGENQPLVGQVLEPAGGLAGQAMACNMTDDIAQEGAAAFIEKRTPDWSADRPG